MSRVFFIDDEQSILNSIKRAFKDSDFETFFFTSGIDAIKSIEVNKPDVVVCDILMPDMNGFEVIEEFKKLSPGTTRVMLTGYADVSTILHSMNSGNVYRFITKPWKDRAEAERIIADSIEYSRFLSRSSSF